MPIKDITPRRYTKKDRRALARILQNELNETDYAVQCLVSLSSQAKPAKVRRIDNAAFSPIHAEYPKLKKERWDRYTKRLTEIHGVTIPTQDHLAEYIELISEYGLIYQPHHGIAKWTVDDNVFELVQRVDRLTPEEMEDAIQGLRLFRAS